MSTTPHPNSIRADIVIALLALISVGLLVIEVVAQLTPADKLFLDRVDITIAVIFLIEWSWRFARAENRRAFFRKYWWELLASIPFTSSVTQALRALRILRILRVARLLRLLRLGIRLRTLTERFEAFAGATHLVTLSTTVGVIILAATLAFHWSEAGSNPAVRSLFDSFWWAMCTVTTVGYGDISPTTTAGRVVALFLMLFGLGVLAAYTAMVASFLVRSDRSERVADDRDATT